MENRNEIKPYLECINDVGTQDFKEGDAVICFAGRKIYSGTIVAFGNYKESEEADPQGSVYLDTSKNNMNRSCEVIKMADITYMCKAPTCDQLGYPQTNEKQDRSIFIDMIVALGHDKGKAEFMYEHMKELIALYNIPLSLALICAIQEANLNVEEKKAEELIEINNKLIDIMAVMLQSVIDSIKKARIPGVE